MPIYVYGCDACHFVEERLESLSEREARAGDYGSCPVCKVALKAQATTFGFAFVTKGGNLVNFSPSNGRVYKGGGRPKPKTIGKGHGVGGRRPNPSIRNQIAAAGAQAEIRALAKGKT